MTDKDTGEEIKKFAAFIREKRERLGLSVADVTELVIGNRKNNYISQIELGSRTGITIIMMERILTALNCSISYDEN